jgi:hypothetical protein
LITAQSDGTIGIQLGPIVEDVKAALLARGLSIAARIPPVDRTIPIAMSDQIGTVRPAIGPSLPRELAAVGGVDLPDRRGAGRPSTQRRLGRGRGRARPVNAAAVLGFAVGRAVLVTAIPASLVPATVTTLFYDTATVPMHDTAVIGVVLALAIAIVAWFAGPFGLPRKLRSLYSDGVGTLRRSAEQHNVTTGRAGDWVYAQRRVLHVVIALGATAAIILLRPLSVSDIVGTWSSP